MEEREAPGTAPRHSGHSYLVSAHCSPVPAVSPSQLRCTHRLHMSHMIISSSSRHRSSQIGQNSSRCHRASQPVHQPLGGAPRSRTPSSEGTRRCIPSDPPHMAQSSALASQGPGSSPFARPLAAPCLAEAVMGAGRALGALLLVATRAALSVCKRALFDRRMSEGSARSALLSRGGSRGGAVDRC